MSACNTGTVISKIGALTRSDFGFDPKALHQLLTNLHLQFRLQTAEKFFPLLGIHGRELAHHLFARFVFRKLAPTNAQSEQAGESPHRDVGLTDHRGKYEVRIKKEEI